MKSTLTIVMATLCLGLTSIAYAGDAASGKKISIPCTMCHGTDGISSNNLYPNIAGQKEAYLVKAIKAYRDGTRKDKMMNQIAQSLPDEDIDNLAAYYSGIK